MRQLLQCGSVEAFCLMQDIREILEKLGLSAYADAFIKEGFDSWETLSDITESDLTDLNVKLGHRRKLQRAIAESRHQSNVLPLKPSLSSTSTSGSTDTANTDISSVDGARSATSQQGDQDSSGTGRTKRKYRRHPKPDPHAPERPASAYVIFSNHMREALKGHDLSFTDMAKIVGERWQVLPSETREKYERQANSAKERYNAELAEYKKTEEYAQYQEYLADFRAKFGNTGTGKRTKTTSDNGNDTPSSHDDSHSIRRMSAASRQSTASLPSEPSIGEHYPKSASPSSAYFLHGRKRDPYQSPTSGSIRPPTSPYNSAKPFLHHRQSSLGDPLGSPRDLVKSRTYSGSSSNPPPLYPPNPAGLYSSHSAPQLERDGSGSTDGIPSPHGTSFHTMIESDGPPSNRILPTPNPATNPPPRSSDHPPLTTTHSYGARLDDPRHSSSLAALLRAGELAREAYKPAERN